MKTSRAGKECRSSKSEKKSAPRALRNFSPAAAAQSAGPLDQFWQDEMAGLTAQSYRGIDEAVAALAEKVCARLGVTGAEAGETREYIAFLFEINADLRKSLASCLGLKE